MDPVIVAGAALVVAFVALEFGHVAGLNAGRRERGEAPTVIRAIPPTFTPPPTGAAVPVSIALTPPATGAAVQLSFTGAPLAPYQRSTGEAHA